MMSACNGTPSDRSAGISAEGDQTQGVLTRLWSELRQDKPDIAIQPIRFPGDLSPHPEAVAESFQLRAILSREDGSMISVQAQLDRLALGIVPDPATAWGYADIMRSSVAVGLPGQPGLAAHEIVERRALGLADSDQNIIYVNNTQLGYQWEAGRQSAVTSSEKCKIRYHFSTTLSGLEKSTPDVLLLKIAMPACPEALSLPGLNRWQANALASTAAIRSADTVAATDDDYVWQGNTWLSHTWGNLPTAGGAVSIDQVSLRLRTDKRAEALVMSASRSKRKSGRGPQTVEGAMSSLEHGEQTLELQWSDEGEQLSPMTGIVYPQRFRIRSNDESVDLLLMPLVALPEIRDSLGIRWEGAVTVSGTHSGVGFMNYQPLTGAGQNLTGGR